MSYYKLSQDLKDVYNSVNLQFQNVTLIKKCEDKRSQNAGPDHRILENMSFINMAASTLSVNVTFDKQPLRK